MNARDRLDGLTLRLDAGLAGLGGPREVEDGNDKEGVTAGMLANWVTIWRGQLDVPVIGNTSKGVVPSCKSG